jgi:hypothetical protein
MRAWPLWAEREGERPVRRGPQWMNKLAWRTIGISVVLLVIAAVLPMVGAAIWVVWFLVTRIV